jgi:hypothetical protein
MHRQRVITPRESGHKDADPDFSAFRKGRNFASVPCDTYPEKRDGLTRVMHLMTEKYIAPLPWRSQLARTDGDYLTITCISRATFSEQATPVNLLEPVTATSNRTINSPYRISKEKKYLSGHSVVALCNCQFCCTVLNSLQVQYKSIHKLITL